MSSILDELFEESIAYDSGFDITKSYKDNPKWIKFSKKQFINILSEEDQIDAENMFEYNSDESLEDEKYYVYFKKIAYEDDDVKIYEGKTEDLLYMKLGGEDRIFNQYQIEGIYRKKNVITITGWDFNTIIDLDDNTIEDESTR